MAASAFVAAALLAAQNAVQHLDPQVDQTERKVRDLASRFAEILTPTPLESQLQARCAVNCSAAMDSQKGLTVAKELENIEARKRSDLARVGAEIQGSVNAFIVSSVSASDETINRMLVIENLSHILSGVTDPPPMAFVLASPQIRALLIFDNIQNGTVGSESSYAALTAFKVDGPKLILSDSTGGDMDGYGRMEVMELNSPVQGEIWLLVSGYMTGANGPNCRMRVFAYDGKKFRTAWSRANVWGTFTTHVTRNGFEVSGDYYQSNQHRFERYQLTADGLYEVPADH
jgi:hypothetical protein